MALLGFDVSYYLEKKLELLQTDSKTSTDWANKTINDLEAVLTKHGLTAESHYMRYGHTEGLTPNAYFNVDEYKAAKAADLVAKGEYANPDLALKAFEAAWPFDAYQHYLMYGAAEGINPSNLFDAGAYLADKLELLQNNADTKAFWADKTVEHLKDVFQQHGLNALTHYLAYGKGESLKATAIEVSGKVSDGYIKGATVFADANGDGVWNEGEARTTTDEQGNFKLEGGSGDLIATGGTDISTNMPFEGTYTAPAGSGMVSPLSTLINQVVQESKGSLNAQQAESAVAKKLGLEGGVDLLNFDPIAAAGDTGAQPGEKASAIDIQAAAVQVANMINQAAATLDGAGIASESQGALSAAAALAQMMFESEDDKEFNLADTDLVEEILEASALKAGASKEELTAVQKVVKDVAAATAKINTAMAKIAEDADDEDDADDIFSDLAKIQVKAEKIEDLAEEGAETGDAGDASDAADDLDQDDDGPATGGGGTTTPVKTFTVTEDGSHILQFTGTATGPITVALSGGDATFTRGGVDSAAIPLATVTGYQDAADIHVTAAQFNTLADDFEAADTITVSDDTLNAAAIATLGADAKVDTIRAANMTLDATQYAAASAKLHADDTITVSDDTLNAAAIATLGADAKVDTIRAANMTLDATQYAAASAKLHADDAITVSDDTLNAAAIATLGADAKVDTIRAANMTLDATQYAAASAKLHADDAITVSDDTLNAAAIATLGADAKVDTIRAANMTLDATQYAAASAKLHADDAITVSDDTLNAAAIATLGADAKVDTIRAANMTLDATQYAAASAKLHADDAITVSDDTLNAAAIATLSADAKVDTIRAATMTLDATQYAAASAKLHADDAITVSDDTLNAAAIATLGADAKVDTIRAATMTLDVNQFGAAGSKLHADDTVNIVDTGSNIAGAVAGLTTGAAVIDSIDASDADAITLSKSQHSTITSAKLATDDTIIVSDDTLNATEIATLGADAKVDTIRAATMTLDATQYAAASAKLHEDDAITVSDDTLNAAAIATLGADAKVDTIRAATMTLDATQYAAASAKLHADDAITVSDDTLNAAAIATLSADAKVDTIRAATMTLDVNQFGAAGSKLHADDTVNIVDTGSNIAGAVAGLTTGAAVIDSIDASDADAITLSKSQHSTITSAKLATDDTIIVSDDTLNATEIATLGADAKVDTIRAATMTLDATQYAAASAKLHEDDTITVADNTASIEGATLAAGVDKLSVNTITNWLNKTNDGTIDTDGNAAGVTEATEWFFDGAGTLTYWDGDSAAEVTLTGVTSITVGDGTNFVLT